MKDGSDEYRIFLIIFFTLFLFCFTKQHFCANNVDIKLLLMRVAIALAWFKLPTIWHIYYQHEIMKTCSRSLKWYFLNPEHLFKPWKFCEKTFTLDPDSNSQPSLCHAKLVLNDAMYVQRTLLGCDVTCHKISYSKRICHVTVINRQLL